MDTVLTEANQKIQKALEYLRKELATIRTGRANPTLIENVPVNAYGSKMKLLEVGTISAPQPNLLTVQVWDVSLVNDVVKALQEASLGLSPVSDGQLVRLAIPPLTTERREEFVKLAHLKMEQARIEIRQIRQDIREGWERDLTEGKFGKDELERRGKILQDLVNKAMDEVDSLGELKEKELLQV